MEELNQTIEKSEKLMDEALDHLGRELTKIRAGKASPAMLQGIMVDYYGNPTPLNQVANVSTPDSKMLSIQPWEKAMIGPVEQAIFAANLGLTPQNNGEMIIINIPPLTEERRLRSVRQKTMEAIKKAVKDGMSEDMGKTKEGEVEKSVKHYVEKIGALISAKEKSIMTI